MYLWWMTRVNKCDAYRLYSEDSRHGQLMFLFEFVKCALQLLWDREGVLF